MRLPALSEYKITVRSSEYDVLIEREGDPAIIVRWSTDAGIAASICAENYARHIVNRLCLVAPNVEQRQAALEVLGGAIAKIMPDFRASGDVVEHATATAEALLREHVRLAARLRDALKRAARQRPTSPWSWYEGTRTILHAGPREPITSAATRVVRERDEAQRDLEVEGACNLALRKKLGAFENETMFDFIERMVRERDEARGVSDAERELDEEREEVRHLEEEVRTLRLALDVRDEERTRYLAKVSTLEEHLTSSRARVRQLLDHLDVTIDR
jgi:hypothetical protein